MQEVAAAPPSLDDAQMQSAGALSSQHRKTTFLPQRESLPTFTELTRCTWGTHVTVHGQPAKFHQAGVVKDRQVVIVLAAHNNILEAQSWRCEPACGGEHAYYFDYEQSELRIGTPLSAPLLREQAATSLREGDSIQVNGCTATFICLKRRSEQQWLTMRAAPEHESALIAMGGEHVDQRKWGNALRLKWSAELKVHLLSAHLPAFDELATLDPGTPITLGAGGVPGKFQSIQVQDGTKRFVVVRAAPWLSVRQAHSQPAQGCRDWIYRIRFEEAGLRLVQDDDPSFR